MVGAGAAAEVGVLGALRGSRSRWALSSCTHCEAAEAVWLAVCSACWWVWLHCGTSSCRCRTLPAVLDHTGPRAQLGFPGT